MEKLIDSDQDLRILHIDEEKAVQLKSPREIFEYFRTRLVPIYDQYDLVIVARGVIDWPNFEHDRNNNTFSNNISAAAFHVHDMVRIFSSQLNRTSTLLAAPENVARATLDTLRTRTRKELRRQFEESAISNIWKAIKYYHPQTTDRVISLLETGLGIRRFLPAEARGEKEDVLSKGLRRFSFMIGDRHHLYSLRPPELTVTEQEDGLLLREIQERIGTKVDVIDWQQSDIAIIQDNVWHCRDIRTQFQRQEGEALYSF